jgi:type I restriction enzyme S subunit
MRLEMIEQLTAMPKYEAYKDSGTEWLGEIPAHWKNQRLKFFSSLKARIGFHGLNTSHFIEEGPICITGTDFKNGGIDFRSCYHVSEYWHALDKNIIVKNGDVLVTKDGTIGKVAVVESLPCKATLNSGVFLLRPKENSRYVFWLLNSDVFETQIDLISRGSTINHLYERDFKNFYFLIPPFPEQTAIAAFLDRKTAQIDQAVAIKEKQIVLLKERKQILIQNAVTRGLTPDAPMRDSGVEWIGKIPAHWDIAKTKLLAEFVLDGTHGSFQRVEDGYRLLSVRNIVNDEFVFRDDDSRVSYRDFKEISSKFLICEGDIQLAIVGATLGKVAITKNLSEKFVTQRSLCTIRVKHTLCLSTFMCFFIRSSPFQSYLWNNAGFSAQPGVYLGTIQNSYIPLPSVQEQKSIVAHIETESTKIDQAITLQQQQIDKLKEYKTTLINSAVTGKIKVPELIEGRVTELAKAQVLKSVEGKLVEDSVA